ncbi:MAG: molybdopterin-binding protein [Bacteroidota bacterium]
MNKFSGTIRGIETSGTISAVKLDVGGDMFTCVLIETPQTATYLQVGKNAALLFKETEVLIGKNLSGMLTAANRMTAVITSIEQGKVLTQVTLKYKEYIVYSIITTQEALDTGIRIGDEVTAIVKSNEISLMG